MSDKTDLEQIADYLSKIEKLVLKRAATEAHRADTAEERLQLLAVQFKERDTLLIEEKVTTAQLRDKCSRQVRELESIKKRQLTKARGIATVASDS